MDRLLVVKPDHFLHQFDRFEEGPVRFSKLAEHAAYLLNQNNVQREQNRLFLNEILDLLREGKAVQAALDIQEKLTND